jgi:glucose/arabinose dehydrogenase
MRLAVFVSLIALAACTGTTPEDSVTAGNGNASAAGAPAESGRPFRVEPLGSFDEPWAMAFLPGTNQALITEKTGRLLLWTPGGEAAAVAGVPQVDYGGQGGLGDVVAHPDFARNRMVYLSWVEGGEGGTRGAVVGRARLSAPGTPPALEGLQILWRQHPKTDGRGHFGHRLALRDGYLFITNGDRQLFDPAQDPGQHLGKIVRLREDGSTPPDNPWASRGGVTAQLWTMGHRNPLGLAFAPDGRLWSHEMGPRGGDELNLVERGANYGYPIVSNGSHYDGRDIPDHPTRPEFAAPKVFWNPAVSPAGLIVYSGRLFPQWRGDALMGALSGEALLRIDLDGAAAREADRWPMGARIREVEEGPDGAVYLLEDGDNGRLLRLTPAR